MLGTTDHPLIYTSLHNQFLTSLLTDQYRVPFRCSQYKKIYTMKYSFRLGESGLVLLLVMAIFVVVIGFVVLKKVIPPTTQPPSVQDELRGGRLLILRLPQSVEPPQEIEIYGSGVAARVHVLFDPNNVAQQVQLSATEWGAIDEIRTRWCQAMPTFRSIQPNEVYYDLGVQCQFDSRRLKIPLDQLPAALDTLLQRVPKLKR